VSVKMDTMIMVILYVSCVKLTVKPVITQQLSVYLVIIIIWGHCLGLNVSVSKVIMKLVFLNVKNVIIVVWIVQVVKPDVPVVWLIQIEYLYRVHHHVLVILDIMIVMSVKYAKFVLTSVSHVKAQQIPVWLVLKNHLGIYTITNVFANKDFMTMVIVLFANYAIVLV